LHTQCIWRERERERLSERVCVRESQERDNGLGGESQGVAFSSPRTRSASVECVCEREREGAREKERERERQTRERHRVTSLLQCICTRSTGSEAITC